MPERFLRFAVVGALGFVLQTAAFAALSAAGSPLVPATILSVEAAVLHNFVWHERWTWRRRLPGARGRWRRLGAFILSTAVTSVAGNVIFVLLYAELFQAGALLAAVLANATAMTVNFAAADRLVFRCVEE